MRGVNALFFKVIGYKSAKLVVGHTGKEAALLAEP